MSPAESQSRAARSLGLLCLAYAVLGLNVSAVLVYGPLYIRQLDPAAGDMLIGLLFAVPSLTGAVGHNLWGALYGRHPDPRRFALLSLAAETLFFSLLLATRSGAALVGLASLFSFFSVAIFPAAKAWGTLAWEEAKGMVLGRLHASESVGWGIATVVSAGTAWLWPDSVDAIRALFAVCLVSSLLLWLLVFLWFPAPRSPAKVTAGDRRSLLGDLAILYRRRDVLGLALYLFVVTCSNVAFFAYYSIYLCHHLGGSTVLLSASMAGATVGGALLYPIYGRLVDARGRRPLLYGSTLGYVGFYGLLCWVHTPWLVAVLFAIPIYPGIRVATNAWLGDLTGEQDRAGGMGLLDGIGSLASVLGPLVGWVFVSTFGYGILPFVPLGLLALGIPLLLALSGAAGQPRKMVPPLPEVLDSRA